MASSKVIDCQYAKCENEVPLKPTHDARVYAHIVRFPSYWQTWLYCSQECARENWPARHEVEKAKAEARVELAQMEQERKEEYA